MNSRMYPNRGRPCHPGGATESIERLIAGRVSSIRKSFDTYAQADSFRTGLYTAAKSRGWKVSTATRGNIMTATLGEKIV